MHKVLFYPILIGAIVLSSFSAASADTVPLSAMDKSEINRVVKQYGKMGACVKDEIGHIRSVFGAKSKSFRISYPNLGDDDMMFIFESPDGKYNTYCAKNRAGNNYQYGNDNDWAPYD